MTSSISFRLLLLVAVCRMYAASHVVESRDTLVRRRLSVPAGRSVALQPDDVTVIRRDTATACKVKAVSDDVANVLRVGRVEPQVFECDFKRDTVRYVHSGNPLLSVDRIILNVYQFDEQGSTEEQLTIDVEILPQSYEIFVTEPLQQVLHVAGSQDSVSAPINDDFVRFKYNFFDGASCLLTYVEQSPIQHFPLAGRLVHGPTNKTVNNLTADCREFLFAGYRYVYNGSVAIDVDFIPLTVEVEDGLNGTLKEKLYLKVNIDAIGGQNTSPELIVNASRGPFVRQFTSRTLTAEMLSATDRETSSRLLVFNVTSRLNPLMHGFLTNSNEPTRQVRSFRQEDLVNRKVVYHPPSNVIEGSSVDVIIELTAIDSHFAVSHPATLTVTVRPSMSLAPRLAVVRGLTLPEGGVQPITLDNLNLVDQSGGQPGVMRDIRFVVKTGMRHGSIEVNGVKETVFSAEDLAQKKVAYRHDNSDSTEDRIVLRVTNGHHAVRIKFPVVILPVDDGAPGLVSNDTLEVTRGGYAQITAINLNAVDTDTSNRKKIFYIIRAQPKAGEIVKRHRKLSRGRAVSKFTQLDIDRGFVYYHNHGGETTRDQLEFRLVDDNNMPNRSGRYALQVKISPGNNLPPHEMEDTERELEIFETNMTVFGRDNLWYEDVENRSDIVVYTVTSQPFYLNSSETADAGRLVAVEDDDVDLERLRYSELLPLFQFTQAAVDEGRVVYQPPRHDVGAASRKVQFVFAVSDQHGNSIMDQTFNITLLPVNNEPPRLTVRVSLRVVEGGSVRLTGDDFVLEDIDTPLDKLTLRLDVQPRFGKLLKDSAELKSGDTFTPADFNTSEIRYEHEGKPSTNDSMTLSLSDGKQQTTTTIAIAVRTDLRPTFVANLNNKLEVDEGSLVVLKSDNLAAIDDTTDPSQLMFHILKTPEFGEISVDDAPVHRFTQGDLRRGAVSYVHTGDEIGLEPVTDVVTLTVSDQPLKMHVSNPVPLLDLEFTVLPRDNSPPQLLIGGTLNIHSGRPATITTDIISAADPDSPLDTLTFVVVQTPMWGFIERSKSTARSGRSQTSRRISSFSMSDLAEGTIQYVPSNLSKGGPPSDSFTLYVTDGKNQSPLSHVEVSVLQVNSRLPDFLVENILVTEGDQTQFAVMLLESTVDDELSQLVLSLSQSPVHGKVVLAMSGDEGTVREIDMRDVSMEDLKTAAVKLVYKHDGSESREDSFIVALSNGGRFNKKTVSVTIQAINDELPELVKNLPATVDFGGTVVITDAVLKATDIDNFNDEIYFIVLAKPKRGFLERSREADDPLSVGKTSWIQLEKGNNFTQLDVDEKRVRYVHVMELTDAQSTDEFLFCVTDGVNTTPSETFVVEISRDNARRILVVNREMVIRDGETKVVSTEFLSADDGSGRPSELTFTVTQSPQHGTLGLAGQTNTPIVRFSQADLRAQRVLYKHSGGNRNGAFTDGFGFTVTPSSSRLYLGTVSGVFWIVVELSDRELPSLDTNVPLTVVEGDTQTLAASNLHVSQPGTPPENLTYIVVERPRHGRLLLAGQPVGRSFTQADIDSDDLEYTNERVDTTMTDYFLFAVADGRHDGYLVNGTANRKPAFFNILIQPVPKDPPKLVHNQAPGNLQSFGGGKRGFVIGMKELQVVAGGQGGVRSADLTYVVKEGPVLGHLEHVESGKQVKKRFTQKDIDDGKLAYVIDEQSVDSTNDSFTFRVQDQHRNVLDDQRFQLQWSVVELEQSEYWVCEDAGSLDVIVTRRGSTAGRVTASIRAKPLSARLGLDFMTATNELIVFAPGVTQLNWPVHIVRDVNDEQNEKFKILLRNPTNALLGDVSKSVVHIVDVINGECSTDHVSSVSGGAYGFDDVTEEEEEEEDLEEEDDVFDGFDEAYESFDSFGVGATGERDDVDEDVNSGPRRRGGKAETAEGRSRDVGVLPGAAGDLWDGWNTGQSDERRPPVTGNNSRRRGGKSIAGGTGFRDEHPLKKYRKGRKNVKKTTTDRDDYWKTNSGAARRPMLQPSTTQKPASAFAPQECTRDTSGLLYFDLLSSKMFRCNGREWQEWGWGTAGDGFQYTALLKDSAPADNDEQQPVGQQQQQQKQGGRREDELVLEGGDVDKPVTQRTTENTPNRPRKRKNCKPGWTLFESDCYRVSADKLSWNEADGACRQDASHVTNVKSTEQLSWLSRLAGQNNFWIGLNDKATPGDWKYTRFPTQTVTFVNWRRNFPRPTSRQRRVTSARGRGSQSPRSCVLVSTGNQWVNRQCDTLRALFICVQPAAKRRSVVS